jgi:hypothetical protein
VSTHRPFAVYARDFIGQPVGGRIVEGASAQAAEAVAVRTFQLTDDHGGVFLLDSGLRRSATLDGQMSLIWKFRRLPF